MNFASKTASIAAALALIAAPAFAAGPPTERPMKNSNPGTAKKAAAPGIYCKTQSKKKAEGQERSDFSTCVRAQAKLRSGRTDSPRTACKEASKKHVKGLTGTPFSRCVVAGAKLLREQKAQDEQAPATA